MKKSRQSIYGLCGKLKAKAGKGDEFARILIEASQMVSTVPGCQMYAVCKDTQDPDMIWVMEVWNTKADHDNSLLIGGVKELIKKGMALMDGKPDGTALDILGGWGVEMPKV